MPNFIDINQLQPILAGFPSAELWRFFVDGTKQHAGWRSFEENEPGYLLGMLRSFYEEMQVISHEKHVPLKASDLLRMHDNALRGVSNTQYDRTGVGKVGAFRNELSYLGQFTLSPYFNLTKGGLKELHENNKTAHHPSYELTVDTSGVSKRLASWTHHIAPLFEITSARGEVSLKAPIATKYFLMNTVSEVDAREYVNARLIYYNQDIDDLGAIENKEEREKAQIIRVIKLVSDLERAHVFTDGNCRTFCMLLLYRELLRHDIIPPIMDDPNVFDGHSQAELYEHVLRGQKRTIQLMSGLPIDDFMKPVVYDLGYSTNTTVFYHAQQMLAVTALVKESVVGDSSVCFELILAEAMPLAVFPERYAALKFAVRNSEHSAFYRQFMIKAKCMQGLEGMLKTLSLEQTLSLVPPVFPTVNRTVMGQFCSVNTQAFTDYSFLLEMLSIVLVSKTSREAFSDISTAMIQNVDLIRPFIRHVLEKPVPLKDLEPLVLCWEKYSAYMIKLLQMEIYDYVVDSIRSEKLAQVHILLTAPKVLPLSLLHACVAGAFVQDKISEIDLEKARVKIYGHLLDGLLKNENPRSDAAEKMKLSLLGQDYKGMHFSPFRKPFSHIGSLFKSLSVNDLVMGDQKYRKVLDVFSVRTPASRITRKKRV